MNLENLQSSGRRYLQYKDLVALGLFNSRETLRRWMNSGKFPRPIHPEEGGSPFWIMDELLAWEDSLKRQRAN